MNTRFVIALALAVSAPPVLADSPTQFSKLKTVTSPFGAPATNPLAPPVTTAPAPPAKKKSDKKDQKPPELPSPPGGGGSQGGQGNGQQKDANGNSSPSPDKSGGGTSSKSAVKKAGNDGLCTEKNAKEVQHTEKGCATLDTTLENGCSAQKLKEAVKKAGKDGKGISDLKKYCGNYDKLPDTKKAEVFKQILAASIQAQSKWNPADGLMKIDATDVDQNQDCHGFDIRTDMANSEKNLKCGACVALTKITKDGVGGVLKDPGSQQNLTEFCKNAGTPSGGGPATAAPAATSLK